MFFSKMQPLTSPAARREPPPQVAEVLRRSFPSGLLTQAEADAEEERVGECEVPDDVVEAALLPLPWFECAEAFQENET